MNSMPASSKSRQTSTIYGDVIVPIRRTSTGGSSASAASSPNGSNGTSPVIGPPRRRSTTTSDFGASQRRTALGQTQSRGPSSREHGDPMKRMEQMRRHTRDRIAEVQQADSRSMADPVYRGLRCQASTPDAGIQRPASASSVAEPVIKQWDFTRADTPVRIQPGKPVKSEAWKIQAARGLRYA